MTRREKRTILLALEILKRAASAGIGDTVQLDAVRLALRVLLNSVDKHSLVVFWRILDDPPGQHRTFRLRKMLQLIEPAAIRHMAGIRNGPT